MTTSEDALTTAGTSGHQHHAHLPAADQRGYDARGSQDTVLDSIPGVTIPLARAGAVTTGSASLDYSLSAPSA